MFRRISQKARKQDGFTLIELIVVVAILGILAAVLTPRVLDAIDNAKANGAEAFGKEIQLAMERYYLDNNGYPATNEVDGSYQDLIIRLDKYAALDEVQFNPDVAFAPVYEARDADGDPLSDLYEEGVGYELIVYLVDSGKMVTVTERTVTVADYDY